MDWTINWVFICMVLFGGYLYLANFIFKDTKIIFLSAIIGVGITVFLIRLTDIKEIEKIHKHYNNISIEELKKLDNNKLKILEEASEINKKINFEVLKKLNESQTNEALRILEAEKENLEMNETKNVFEN